MVFVGEVFDDAVPNFEPWRDLVQTWVRYGYSVEPYSNAFRRTVSTIRTRIKVKANLIEKKASIQNFDAMQFTVRMRERY